MVFIIVGLNLSCFRASLGDNDTIHHIQFDNPEEESYCDRYFYETQVTVERNLYAALILESSGTNMTISVESTAKVYPRVITGFTIEIMELFI